jgi:hypothetical protein
MKKRDLSLILLILLVFFSINLISAHTNSSCHKSCRCNDCEHDDWNSWHDYHDCDRDCYRGECDNWECDEDNECHRCNKYGNSYMAVADQQYQDILNFYNSQQTQKTQQTPAYEVIIIPNDDNQGKTNDFLSGNWPAVALISISALILLIIVMIIIVAVRK